MNGKTFTTSELTKWFDVKSFDMGVQCSCVAKADVPGTTIRKGDHGSLAFWRDEDGVRRYRNWIPAQGKPRP